MTRMNDGERKESVSTDNGDWSEWRGSSHNIVVETDLIIIIYI